MGKTTDYPLKSLISFDALENPPWHARTNESQTKTVTEMITQIKEYHMKWKQARAEKTYSEKLIKKVSFSKAMCSHFAPIAPSQFALKNSVRETSLVPRGFVSVRVRKLDLRFFCSLTLSLLRYRSSFSSNLFTMLTWRKDMG